MTWLITARTLTQDSEHKLAQTGEEKSMGSPFARPMSSGSLTMKRCPIDQSQESSSTLLDESKVPNSQA
eukprot:CAMPEP_0181186920 /NCGR_PEP_ID=MMETSP1096-20121128/10290_1 /TAXON_ID=156174 ORGANISM="Chrysochromulina ericina, Strain CCMP281" /NCGR_SAMPLE_ID=MMETSP1096 /ASSEMBLY_ACC=CAM_ASM_000453 /LENGTH=68 /DNA_ID=CAMNT_0023275847 /DNA_START=277 /DNA_END=483 /DNA_ORIENTATION=-